MPHIILPAVLKKYTNQTVRLTVSGHSIHAMLQQLFQHFPPLENILFKAPGTLSQYVNLYLNNLPVKNHLEMLVQNDDELTIIPALSGG